MIREAGHDDIPALNLILNDPNVRPTAGIGATGSLDISKVMANRRNVAFIGDYGGAVFGWSAPRVFEGHSFFLPSGRGAWAIDAGHQMLAAMFAKGARTIWGQTPIQYREARWFNRRLGFRSLGFDVTDFGAGTVEVELFHMEAICP